MNHSIKFGLMGGMILFCLSMCLTSCEDILGEWSKPTPATAGGGSAVSVTGITLDPTTLSMKVGDADVTLTANVTPDNATDKAVTWSSNKESVATVTDGVVHAVGEGTATITAKAGDKSATCTVTVTDVYTAQDYKKRSWNGTKVDSVKQTATSPTEIANGYTGTIASGWYTVTGDNVVISGTQTLTDDTYLILCDGAKLTINGQLNATSYDLHIYGQKKGDGKLNVTTNSGTVINSNKHIDIHGGEVTAEATGGTNIGLYTGYLAVYGGKLTATSGGSVGLGFKNTIDVYGGEVVATSNATSSSSPWFGILSSSSSDSKILTVYGGKVTATGNGQGDYGSGFGCYVKSGTSGIKFYFSADGTWGDGTSYTSATSAGRSDSDAATKKRYAKAE